MKLYKRVLTITLALITLFAFESAAFALNITGASDFPAVNNVKGVTLTTDRRDYNTKEPKITITITNTSKIGYDFGVEYYLEKMNGGTWYRCGYIEDISFPLIGFTVFPNKKYTQETKPAELFGDLEDGLYRIIWKISDENTNQPYFISTEFIIKATDTLYATEPVSIRSGAGTKYKVLGKLQINESVKYLGTIGQWMQVQWGNKTGYISGKYLSVNKAKLYAKAPVNVRSGPGAKYQTLGYLVGAQEVIPVGESGRWVKIAFNGGYGYVYDKYLGLDVKQ